MPPPMSSTQPVREAANGAVRAAGTEDSQHRAHGVRRSSVKAHALGSSDAFKRSGVTVTERVGKAVRDPRTAMDVATGRVVSLRSVLEGALDAFRLRRAHPRLVPEPSAHRELRARYDEYVAEVSTAGMAMSWKSATYLLHLCYATAPRRALDLGSGFSSYVLRQYAATARQEVAVVSVDDSEAWLARTGDFLAAHGAEEGELRSWSEFAADPGEPFDVIFHDLAGGGLRNAGAGVAVGALAPRGVLLFDDTHDASHRAAARRVARDAGLAAYSLYRWTHDAYGRFSTLLAT
jgi:predicted O-methyltransferase YrrM